jgi:hypothetical protein
MIFFKPLVENGFPFLKHGRSGWWSHSRLMWLDISTPERPSLVWHDGALLDRNRVKDKDRVSLDEIVEIKAGRTSDVLIRSGRDGDADRYMTFYYTAGPPGAHPEEREPRTLDCEFPTPQARDWFFTKFAALFQAYATARLESRKGDDVTLRVVDIMDHGASAEVGGGAKAAAAARGGGGGGGRAASPRGRGADAGAGTGDRGGARSRSPRGGGGGGGGGAPSARRGRSGSFDGSAGYYAGGGGAAGVGMGGTPAMMMSPHGHHGAMMHGAASMPPMRGGYMY